MSDKDGIENIARQFSGKWTRGYVRGKMRSDPAYRATLDLVRDSSLPILDIGCGMGLLAFYLREHGFPHPILGVDFDEKKIGLAQGVVRYSGLEFRSEDASAIRNFSGNVVILDVLQYLTAEKQIALLQKITALIPAGGRCILRGTPRDKSWRYRLTEWDDRLMHFLRWMKSPVVEYLTKDEISAPFLNEGFAAEVKPLWGKTPFNSYLFVFEKKQI